MQTMKRWLALVIALVLLVGAAGFTQSVLPTRPFVLKAVTALLLGLVTAALVVTFFIPMLSVTALESVVVGLALLWMTTFARVLSILTPNRSVASQRRRLVQRRSRAGTTSVHV